MPQVQYRDPNGNVVTTDLNNAPPQVQTLYNQNYLQPQAQLQQTQAGAAVTSADIPGAVARSQTAEVQAKQAGALQNLNKDLQGKITLKSALSKYTALGMSPDEVFTQYLNTSPYGLPKESPQELINLGIKPETLGQIGTPGSFMDRWNTRNAILGLRDLQDKFHKTNALSQVSNFLGLGGSEAASYNSARQIFGEHLSSLIPGASGAASSVSGLLDTLPNAGDFREYNKGKADAQFQSVEDQLLKTKGYNPSDLGIPAQTTQSQKTTEQTTKTGKDLLTSLLGNAGKDISSMAESEAAKQAKGEGGFGGAIVGGILGLPGFVKNAADIVENPQKQFTEHPVNSALTVLAPLLGLKGGGAAEGEAGAAPAAEADAFAKAPGKLQQFFTPGKAKNVIGQIRDNIISNADKAGTTVSGDDIANSFRQWANQAKLSNPADSQAIEEAAQNFEKEYTDKSFKPSQLKSIYDNIEKGFTQKGQPRTATSAFIDRGVQDVLQGHLEDAAPGFAKTTDLFRQTYQAEKSPLRSTVKRAAPVALGLAGLHELEKILGPIFNQ